MTELVRLLERAEVHKAVVIDDVFDEVPRADELGDENWAIFFDDLDEDGRTLLSDLYSGYDEKSPEELKQSQEFISVVWENRNRLPAKAGSALFSDYERTCSGERKELEKLVAHLRSLGLVCTPLGRGPDEKAKDADLVVIDLFLGYQQSEGDLDRAVRRVSQLVKDRAENPPLVILMSSSPRLLKRKGHFRDQAGLLASTFRVVSKEDLRNPGVLNRLLRRLVGHYEDAKRVARFIHAWDAGLDQARKNFIRMLRRLDLSDLAQMQALLLEFEGQKLGEYLLDVVDDVLRHEIEGDRDTISAALELNRIDLTRYPAPHLADTPDLQELVCRMVFMHSNRLRLSKDNSKMQLRFGDLLRWQNDDGTDVGDEVSLVITPACDLVRNGTASIALLSGRLENLQPENWSYRDRPVRTAVVILPGEDRKWIEWNLKNVRTLSWDELDNLCGEAGRLIRIGRLRELCAIEIQQMTLAGLGRVGRPANLPGPFPVDVSVFYVSSDLKAREIDAGGIEPATCYVGRDEDSKPIHRLVLTEQTCDCLERTLCNLDGENVHPAARSSLDALKGDSDFFDRLERGEMEIPTPGGGPRKIRGGDHNIYAVAIRNDGVFEGSQVSNDWRKAAFVLKVSDV